jgi:hypothetical protein
VAELLAEGIGERSKGTVNLVSLWSSLVAIAKGRKGRMASGSDLIRRGWVLRLRQHMLEDATAVAACRRVRK